MQTLTRLSRDYGVACLAALLACLAAEWLGPDNSRTVLALHLAAAVAGTFFGGLRAGLLGTGLTGLSLFYHYGRLPPARSGLLEADSAVSLMLFLGIGFVISYLNWECLGALVMADRIEQALAGLRDAVLLTDDQGRITFLNRAAQLLTGWRGTDARQQPLETVLSLGGVEGGPPEELLARLRQPDGLAIADGTARLVARDGTEKAVAYEAEYLHGGGRPAGAVLVLRDLGERRQLARESRRREHELRAVTAAVPVGILHLDADGRCLHANPACLAVAGLAPDLALGDGWRQFLGSADQEAAVLRGDSVVREFCLDRAPGSPRWVRLRGGPISSEEGERFGHVVTLEDVTPHQRLEREVVARRQAEEAFRQGQQDHEHQARARVEALENARVQLQEQLDESRRLEKQRHLEIAQVAEAHQRAQQQLAEAHRLAQQQLAERRQLEEELRRRQAEARAGWEELERQLRQEIAQLLETQKHREAELAEAAERQSRHAQERRQQQDSWQREADEHRRQLAFWRELHEGAPAALLTWDRQGELVAVNRTARLLLDLPPEGPLPDRWENGLKLYDADGQTPLAADDSPLARAGRREPFDEAEVVVRTAGGTTRTLSVSGVRPRGADAQDHGFVLALQDVTAQRRTAAELRDLHLTERRQGEEERARLRREQLQQEQALKRVAFLAGATQELSASLDFDRARRSLARLAIPFLADGCVLVDARDENGAVPVAVAVVGAEGPREWDAGNEPRVPLPDLAALAGCVRTPEPALYAEVPAEWRSCLAELLALPAAGPLSVGSLLCVPLTLPGRSGSLVVLVRREDAAPYGGDDLALAQEFVRRALGALANALRHQEARDARAELARQLHDLGDRLREEAERRREAEGRAEVRPAEADLWDDLARDCRPLLAQLCDSVRSFRQGPEQDPAVAEPATALEGEARRLALVLQRYWTLARLRADSLPLRQELVDLAVVIERAVEATHLVLLAGRQHLTVSLPLGPEWLQADADYLAQAVALLLEDASQCTPAGGELRLTAERCRDRILVRVTADGEAGDPGTGHLLVQRLAELHGGTLEVAGGGPGQGREWLLDLPAAPRPPWAEPGFSCSWLPVRDRRPAAQRSETPPAA